MFDTMDDKLRDAMHEIGAELGAPMTDEFALVLAKKFLSEVEDPLHAQAAMLAEALRDAVGGDAMSQDEQGGCVWCGGPFGKRSGGYAGNSKRDHAKDCPWIVGRSLLKSLPDSIKDYMALVDAARDCHRMGDLNIGARLAKLGDIVAALDRHQKGTDT